MTEQELLIRIIKKEIQTREWMLKEDLSKTRSDQLHHELWLLQKMIKKRRAA